MVLCRCAVFYTFTLPMKKSILALAFLCLSFSSFAQVQPTSGAERLKGLSGRQQMEKSSLLKNVKFRNVGPTIMSGRAVDLDESG